MKDALRKVLSKVVPSGPAVLPEPPDNPDDLAMFIRKHIEIIRRAKKLGRRMPEDLSRWVKRLATKLVNYRISTMGLGAEEKFAALFVVNSAFHSGQPGARDLKDVLIRVIACYHATGCTLTYVPLGKFADTYLVSYGSWATHVPASMVVEGRLERPGKPRPVWAKLRQRREALVA